MRRWGPLCAAGSGREQGGCCRDLGQGTRRRPAAGPPTSRPLPLPESKRSPGWPLPGSGKVLSGPLLPPGVPGRRGSLEHHLRVPPESPAEPAGRNRELLTRRRAGRPTLRERSPPGQPQKPRAFISGRKYQPQRAPTLGTPSRLQNASGLNLSRALKFEF